MDKINGVIVLESTDSITKEELLVKIINIYKIEDILNIKLESKYFESSNKKGDYILDIKKNNEELLKYIIVVKQEKKETPIYNFSVISIFTLIIIILTIIVSMIISKIRLNKKKKAFFNK